MFEMSNKKMNEKTKFTLTLNGRKKISKCFVNFQK